MKIAFAAVGGIFVLLGLTCIIGSAVGLHPIMGLIDTVIDIQVRSLLTVAGGAFFIGGTVLAAAAGLMHRRT